MFWGNGRIGQRNWEFQVFFDCPKTLADTTDTGRGVSRSTYRIFFLYLFFTGKNVMLLHYQLKQCVLACLLALFVTAMPAAAQTCGQCRPTLFSWDGSPADPLPPASERPLVTDRPDFTEASSVVGLGVFQAEMGYTYTRDDGPQPTESHSAPELLLRIGIVAEWFELRLGYTAAQDQGGGVTHRGSDDMFVGMKVALAQQDCCLPEVAFLGELQLPTGSSALTADQVLSRGGIIYGWELNDCWSTAGQTILAHALDETTGSSYLEVSQSWTVAHSITDNIGVYSEWFATMPQRCRYRQGRILLRRRLRLFADR